MLSVCQIAKKQLVNKNLFAISLKKQRPLTSKELDKYDVVVVGAGLGNVFSSHLDAVLGPKVKIFQTYDNLITQLSCQRNLYEAGDIVKYKYGISTRQLLGKYIAQSDYIGVDKINCDKNEIVLKNGRVIKYEHLVLAPGQKMNYHSIKGFEENWAEPHNNFFTNVDHPSWRSSVTKSTRTHLNFNGGEAIFYIPPGNYFGEIQDYNFFASKAKFDGAASTGKISWETSKFTVINGNSSFVKYAPDVDAFITKKCKSENIAIEHGLELVEVRKADNVAVFKDLVTGRLIERMFGHFYCLMPTIPNSLVKESGLADATGYFDANKATLQHTKYDNIYGLGDILNVPTTKTFFGGVSQVAVLRNNIEKRLNGLKPNAEYDGYAKSSMLLSPSNIADVEHKYDGKDLSFNTNSLKTSLNMTLYSMTGKHQMENILKFKNWGPPYYKLKKTFEEKPESAPVSPASLTPEKKSA